MSATPRLRFESGQACPESGRYSCYGYTDGSWLPPPAPDELTVDMVEGERFPRIRPGRACWWVPEALATVSAEAT